MLEYLGTNGEIIGIGSSSIVWDYSDNKVIIKCDDVYKIQFYEQYADLYDYVKLDNNIFTMRKYIECDIHEKILEGLIGLIQLLISSTDIVLFGKYATYDELLSELTTGYFKSFASILKYVDAIKEFMKSNHDCIFTYDIKPEHIMLDSNGEYVIIDPICTTGGYDEII